jgi:hypothetical protein
MVQQLMSEECYCQVPSGSGLLSALVKTRKARARARARPEKMAEERR